MGAGSAPAPVRVCANCGVSVWGKGRVYCPTCSCERRRMRSQAAWMRLAADARRLEEKKEYRRWWWKQRMSLPRYRRADRRRRALIKRRHLRALARVRPCAECGRPLGARIVNGRLSPRTFCDPCGYARALASTRRSRARLAVAA